MGAGGALPGPLDAAPGGPRTAGIRPSALRLRWPARARLSRELASDRRRIDRRTADPGHSTGHTSYLVRTKKGDMLLAGDVTYDLPALKARRNQGFIADVAAHRKTLDRVLSLVRSGVAYLPSTIPRLPAACRMASSLRPMEQ